MQGRALDYPTLGLEEIKNIHEYFLGMLNPEHSVFIWTIEKFLPDTEEMFKSLGYTLHARMVWDKTNGVAPAFTVRFSHEYLLWFYKKGKMLKPRKETRGKYTTCFQEVATKHSKKPKKVYEMLEDMFPDANKLELFAREKRDGWKVWGNEIESDIKNLKEEE